MQIMWKKKAKGGGKKKLRASNLGEDEYWDAVEDALANGDEYPEGHGHADEGPGTFGVSPVWTGLLNHHGDPVIRHPMRIRVGFHMEDRKYHAPTTEDDEDGSGSIVGWAYEY